MKFALNSGMQRLMVNRYDVFEEQYLSPVLDRPSSTSKEARAEVLGRASFGENITYTKVA